MLGKLRGVHALFGGVLYGAGLRIMEGVRLRVQDVDLARRQIVVRNGKGFKDRVTMIPDRLVGELMRQLVKARRIHEDDLAEGQRRRLAAVRPGSQVAERRSRMVLAIRVPGKSMLAAIRAPASSTPPSERSIVPASDATSAPGRGDRQGRHAAHAASLVRHSPARIGLRHSHRAGTARTRRRPHDDDLHARPQPWRPRRTKPARRLRGYRGRSSSKRR